MMHHFLSQNILNKYYDQKLSLGLHMQRPHMGSWALGWETVLIHVEEELYLSVYV